MNAMVLLLLLALLAERNSTRKTLFLEMFKAGIVGRKLAVEIINRVPQVLWDGLISAVHFLPQ